MSPPKSAAPAQPVREFLPEESGITEPTAADQIIPMEELERRAILNAMKACSGAASIAAAKLGISQSTLYRKLKEYEA